MLCLTAEKKTLPVHIVLDVILISLVVLSRCVEKKELSAGAGEPHAECGMCKLLRNQRYILYKSLEPPNFFLFIKNLKVNVWYDLLYFSAVDSFFGFATFAIELSIFLYFFKGHTAHQHPKTKLEKDIQKARRSTA